MKPPWRRRARWALLRAQRVPPVAELCRKGSAIATRRLGARLLQVPGVEGVLARHTDPASSAFVLGHSDLDLTLLVDEAIAEDPARVSATEAAVGAMARGHPLIEAQDVRITTRAELGRLRTRLPAPVELLYRPDDWVTIAGLRVDLPPPAPYPPALVPWHPEFNKWWDNMVQLQVLRPSQDQERGYARALFRCALKSHLILEWAESGRSDPAAVLHEDLARVDFSRNVELGEVLHDLQRAGLWTREPGALAACVLRLTLDAATRFYGRRTSTAPAAPVAGETGPAEPDRAVADALRSRVSAAASGLPGFRAAVAYPLPHAGRGRYRVDLVVADRLEPAAVARLIDGVRSAFGRSFDVAGGHVDVKIVPDSAYTNPLYWQGMPGPFLAEHVRARGWVVHGDAPLMARPPRERPETATWVGAYLPFHMFNLRRRLASSSHVLNFNQLASLRLYLEADEILTDGTEVRDRYVDRWGATGDARDTLVRLLERFDPSPPADAREFVRLSEEYDTLETLVMESENSSR